MMKTKMTTMIMIMIMNGDHGRRPLTRSKCTHSSGPMFALQGQSTLHMTANNKQMNANNEQETTTTNNNNEKKKQEKETRNKNQKKKKKKQEKTTLKKEPFTRTFHLNFHPRNIDVSHIGLVHLVGWFLTHKVLTSNLLDKKVRTTSVILKKVY